jgi:hypothetical protein
MPRTDESVPRRPGERVVFWSLEAGLLVAYVLTALWIGPVFFLLALGFAFVRPYRRRRGLWWILYAASIGAVTGLMLFSPLACLDRQPIDTCRSFVPIHYRVPFPDAPIWPGVVGMFLGAVILSVVANHLVSRSRRVTESA